MTSKQIMGGSIAVFVFLAFIGSVVVTRGWSFVALLATIVLFMVFMGGATAAGK